MTLGAESMVQKCVFVSLKKKREKKRKKKRKGGGGGGDGMNASDNQSNPFFLPWVCAPIRRTGTDGQLVPYKYGVGR